MTVTRYVWRPGASEDTIRVDVLERRIAEDARIAAQYGRHALIGDPPAVDQAPAIDEVPGDDKPTQPLCTHPQLLTHGAAA